MLEPPARLPVDPKRGVVQVLVLPFNEPCSEAHEHAGRVFHQGDVRLPPDPDDVFLNVDHGDKPAGVCVAVMSNRHGLWASVKLGHEARELVARGYTSVSGETDDEGRLSGIALAYRYPPAFASAKVLTDGFVWPSLGGGTGGAWSGVGVTEPGASPAVLVLNGERPPVFPPRQVPAADVGAAKAEVYASSMAAVAEQLETDRRLRAERLAAFAAAEAEREEDLLRASMVPMSHWPAHTAGRRQWETLVAAQEAEHEADRRRVEAAAIRELIDRWHAREMTPTRERRPSWLSRIFRVSHPASRVLGTIPADQRGPGGAVMGTPVEPTGVFPHDGTPSVGSPTGNVVTGRPTG
jgi:hypothetical protein